MCVSIEPQEPAKHCVCVSACVCNNIVGSSRLANTSLYSSPPDSLDTHENTKRGHHQLNMASWKPSQHITCIKQARNPEEHTLGCHRSQPALATTDCHFYPTFLPFKGSSVHIGIYHFPASTQVDRPNYGTINRCHALNQFFLHISS